MLSLAQSPVTHHQWKGTASAVPPNATPVVLSDGAKRRVEGPVVAVTVAILLACASLTATAETSTIRVLVLNGHTGKPVTGKSIFFNIMPDGPPAKPPLEFSTDNTGAVPLSAPVTSSIQLHVIEYPTCTKIQNKDRAREYAGIPMEAITTHGVVRPNSCSKFTVPPHPGELVVFVRPLHWWERLSD